jgi:hypothetical protein
MSISKAIAWTIWVVVVGGNVIQAPAMIQMPAPNAPWPILLFPPVFLILMAFIVDKAPDQSRTLALWTDRVFGAGSYVTFLRDLKPMLMFGTMGCLTALSGLTTSLWRGWPIPVIPTGFLLSTGLGFLLARTVYARRGLLTEEPLERAPWAGRSFVPRAVRAIRATKMTAAATGAAAPLWTIAGDHLGRAMADPTITVVWIGSFLLFHVIAAPLFVMGLPEPPDPAMPARRRALRCAARVACWALGAMISAIVLFWLNRRLGR